MGLTLHLNPALVYSRSQQLPLPSRGGWSPFAPVATQLTHHQTLLPECQVTYTRLTFATLLNSIFPA